MSGIYLFWLLLTFQQQLYAAVGYTFSPVTTTRDCVPRTSLQHGSSSSNNNNNNDHPNEKEEPEPAVFQVDTVLQKRKKLVYNAQLDRFIDPQTSTCHSSSSLLRKLQVAFVPQVDNDSSRYYQFVQWRLVQRFINGNIQVLGTRALLTGLGWNNNHATKRNTATVVAASWILKDAWGKLVRVIWATRMGGRFDHNCVRWRFRASIVHAIGNALEIIMGTTVRGSFLFWACLANASKQVAYLTHSATRSAIYRSFTSDHLGDVTAKGEAQIAVVDLCGMLTGVWIVSPFLMTERLSWTTLVTCFGLLQMLELLAVYKMLRAVQFRVLNYERLVTLVDAYAASHDNQQSFPTPSNVADTERIILPTPSLARQRVAYGSLCRADSLSPAELDRLRHLFRHEQFLLIVNNNGNKNKTHNPRHAYTALHTNATNVDIVKSTLALYHYSNNPSSVTAARCDEAWDALEDALQWATDVLPEFLAQVKAHGWESPEQRMLGRVRSRTEW